MQDSAKFEEIAQHLAETEEARSTAVIVCPAPSAVVPESAHAQRHVGVHRVPIAAAQQRQRQRRVAGRIVAPSPLPSSEASLAQDAQRFN